MQRGAWRLGWKSAGRGGSVRALRTILPLVGVFAPACADEAIVGPRIDDHPVPPAISGIELAAVATTEATVVFWTDRPVVGQVEYGTTAAYGTVGALEASPTLAHSVVLTGLTPATTYHYRVTARDA